MCTEVYYRFRRCGHVRFLRWDYCSVIIPADRLPDTGRTCRLYKMRYKDNQNHANCFVCLKERGIVGEISESLKSERDRRTGKTESCGTKHKKRGGLRELVGRPKMYIWS